MPVADINPDAAILLMLLADDQAAQIVEELSPREIEMLGKAMVALNEVGSDAAEGALNRFVESARNHSVLRIDGTERARSVLTKALGDGRGDAVMAKLVPAAPMAQIAPLKWMRDEDIVAVIEREHAQVGAAILADVEPDRAAQLMQALTPARQEDVVRRMARLGSIGPLAIEELTRLLGDGATKVAPVAVERSARVTAAAAVLSKMAKPLDQQLLRAIGKRDKALAQDIADEMFVFADVLKLDTKNLSAVVRAVDAAVLVLAMRTMSDPERERMLAGLSARAADTIRDELAEAAPVALSDVESAQKAIVGIVRQMENDGALQTGGGAAYV
jgi:flagellar motor switch protein FliG